jgi:hypothetical protein
MPNEINIHGDNILECERTLELIKSALDARIDYVNSPIYNPAYTIKSKNLNLIVKLFPGYNRWNIHIWENLESLGAPLREATDSLVTRIVEGKEVALFSIEFCNALPAGNNAWQRTGRALACAYIKLPYLHISDVGGVELGGGRKLKAHRTPNPIIPFAYSSLCRNYTSFVLPIYLPSPSSTKELKDVYKNTFGLKPALRAIKAILNEEEISKYLLEIEKTNLTLVKLLSGSRKRSNTLKGIQWDKFLSFNSGSKRLEWLSSLGIKWTKKTSSKVQTTKTFDKLLSVVKTNYGLSIGAADIPICIIPKNKRKKFGNELKEIYGNSIDSNFLSWVSQMNESLVVVWITGFKPRGDDSRPDRGLVPLARMLLGPDVKIISIVYGPAKRSTWSQFDNSLSDLAKQNGLWQAIINFSDAVLVDSITRGSPTGVTNRRLKNIKKKKIEFPLIKNPAWFSEHDVDSVIHYLFNRPSQNHIFECMCNPPGGDWSGLSFFDFNEKKEYRWTSLPRVSKTNGKRPDHVLQLELGERTAVISVESKDRAQFFSEGIGERLNRYTKDLITSKATVVRDLNGEWAISNDNGAMTKNIDFYSAGAFCLDNIDTMDEIMENGKFDIILALEFILSKGKVKLHVKTKRKSKHLLDVLNELILPIEDRLEVEIH